MGFEEALLSVDVVDGTGVEGIWGDSGRMEGCVAEPVTSRHK